MVFYGYNGGSKIDGAPEYDMISYGVTAGVDVDIKMGNKGNKLSAGLFVPFRSKKFMDNYDAIKNDYRATLQTELLPIAVGVGYVLWDFRRVALRYTSSNFSITVFCT